MHLSLSMGIDYLPDIPGRNVDPPVLVHGEASEDCTIVETVRYLISIFK